MISRTTTQAIEAPITLNRPTSSETQKKFERRKFAANPPKMEISFAIITGEDFAAITKAVVATGPRTTPDITNLK